MVRANGRRAAARAASATSRSSWASSSAISSERASWRRATERSANLVTASTSSGSPPGRKRAAIGQRWEPAQTATGLVRCGDEHRLQQVGRLNAGLHRRATGAPERSGHLHAAVPLGHTAASPAKTAPGGALGVSGVGLAFATTQEVATLGPLDLHYRDPRRPRWRASPARNCRSLPPRHMPRGRSPLPS